MHHRLRNPIHISCLHLLAYLIPIVLIHSFFVFEFLYTIILILTSNTLQSSGHGCSPSSTAPKLAPHVLYPLVHSYRSISPIDSQSSLPPRSDNPSDSLHRSSNLHWVTPPSSNYAAVHPNDCVSYDLVHQGLDVADCTAECATRLPV